MAEAIEFPDQTDILRCPKTIPGCRDLPIARVEDPQLKMPAIVSCWQLSEEELNTLKENGGKIYFIAWGVTHPPISLTSKYPFNHG